ncbi:putative esterase of the alpha-beta hydrolase superfamily [Rozella allomycis CSF55]|uniref:Putative esterase of the alpha-beta hydrolase superfamily n=1 Tax=Rozella allomycis (strain CSF55) TaxID=988480 RepID=A0A4P9YCS7_ROZAC|nr:putative esterase of the alpha-beta hydrolase superfamily [Rozella allomycis CSF55]
MGLFGLGVGVVSTLYAVSYEVSVFWISKIYELTVHPMIRRRHCYNILATAETYEQWKQAAMELDMLEGNDVWKRDPSSNDFDDDMIASRLDQMRVARSSNDIPAMLFLIKTNLSRNIGDIANPKLFSFTNVGTKHIIDEYINEVITHLKILSEYDRGVYRDITLRIDFFKALRRAFGNTALLLSGGGTLGMKHVGVIKSLHEQKLLPRIISGSSSGSIVAAIISTRTDKELDTLLDTLENFNFDAFSEPSLPDDACFIAHILKKVERFIKSGVLFDVESLRTCMRLNLGDMTFLEAYNRTRRILNITVSSSTIFEMPRLLNYLTAPNVVVWSAVVTSCSIPNFFKASPLIAKDKNGAFVSWNPSGDTWIDGSFENDLPMRKLSEVFNVNHFIVSQTNPHVYLFIPNELKSSWKCSQLIDLGIFPSIMHRVRSILSQRYMGDITIVPLMSIVDLFRLFSNPTKERILDYVRKGELATWPKLSIIQNHCRVETTLDEILYNLRCIMIDQLNINKSIGQIEMEEHEMEGNACKDNMATPVVSRFKRKTTISSLSYSSLTDLHNRYQ